MPVIQTNYRADKYVLHITRLIDKNIDACKKLFPESIRFDYIKTLFVVPKYERKGVLIKEYEKFKGKRKLYPFQMYIYWEPDAYGNILYSDSKLLTVVYAQNGEPFYDSYKYRDASDDVKENIYDFIRKSGKVIMAVDCENADPYKLYGVIKNLKKEELEKITRIVLYDDYHTTIAWDYIEKLISIPVVHIEVERVTDRKSLVDMRMAVGVTEAYLTENIDFFILSSGDSDFWELTKQIYADAYIQTSEDEMKRFCDKYIKSLRLKIDENGRFRVVIIE